MLESRNTLQANKEGSKATSIKQPIHHHNKEKSRTWIIKGYREGRGGGKKQDVRNGWDDGRDVHTEDKEYTKTQMAAAWRQQNTLWRSNKIWVGLRGGIRGGVTGLDIINNTVTSQRHTRHESGIRLVVKTHRGLVIQATEIGKDNKKRIVGWWQRRS